MRLENSLRNVFKIEEELYDLSTTDSDKLLEFAKGDFKRFTYGGGVKSKPPPVLTGTTGYSQTNKGPSFLSPFVRNTPIHATSHTGKNLPPRFPVPYTSPAGGKRWTSFVNQPGFTVSGSSSTGGGSGGSPVSRVMSTSKPTFSGTLSGIANSLTQGIQNVHNWATNSAGVKKFISNLKANYAAGKIGGAAGPGSAEYSKQFQRLGVGARQSAGARFSTRNPQNSPVTRALASAFNPNYNPSLAAFTMANRGTQNVAVGGLGKFTDKISARRTKYFSSSSTPQTVTFTLPPRA